MEVITIESQAFKELTEKLNTITQFVATLQNGKEDEPIDGWVDNHDVCQFLKISTKTLQRLRSNNKVSYSKISGKNYYRISEIQRLLNENIIRHSDVHLQDLIKDYKWQAKKKYAIKIDN